MPPTDGSDRGDGLPRIDVPSLQVVLDFAREDYHRQIARGESIVSRSATFLGLVAVFIGLVATVRFSGTCWRVLSVAGVALLALAVVAFVYVVATHWYVGAPATEGLIDDVTEPVEKTRLQILGDTRTAVEENEKVLKRVESWYRRAAILAAAGTVAVAIGIILALVTNAKGA
jgi:hypothetical protein